MRSTGVRALPVNLARRITEVEDESLHHRAAGGDQLARCALRQLRQHLRLNLEVPGVVDLAGLQRRAGSACGVTTTLQLDLPEEGLVRVAIQLVNLVDHDVAGLELAHLIRPS